MPLVPSLPASRLTCGASALLAAFLLGQAPAAGHTELERSDPADGSLLATAPRLVRLEFNVPVQPGLARTAVTGPGATRVDGPATIAGDSVVQALVPGGAGRYTVAYRVVADDGHPVTGELSFTVTAAGGKVTGSAVSSASPTPIASPTAAPAADADAGADAGGGGSVLPYAAAGLAVLAVAAALASRARRR